AVTEQAMTNRVRVPAAVRELPKSLSGIYRNACPGITEIRVREFAKPALAVEGRQAQLLEMMLQQDLRGIGHAALPDISTL
ncbi:MAG: hypothetical protein ABJH07_23585, partial [Sedimentitalea sp.]|uniref:hypothetical protein n=1 Tax=Sedimentitalea sp. TaxID=2048915 RepID=UPI0032675373